MKQLTDLEVTKLVHQAQHILDTLETGYDEESICKIMSIGLIKQLYIVGNASVTTRVVSYLNENINALFEQMACVMTEEVGQERRTIN
jgi:hypothetical protein